MNIEAKVREQQRKAKQEAKRLKKIERRRARRQAGLGKPLNP
jgi:hypothetical protein